MTSFASGTARYDEEADAYLFEGVARCGSKRFAAPRALVERIAGHAANPHAPEDLFDELEPILFRMAQHAYRQRGTTSGKVITLVAEDLD